VKYAFAQIVFELGEPVEYMPSMVAARASTLDMGDA
jgi:hypothetical protein